MIAKNILRRTTVLLFAVLFLVLVNTGHAAAGDFEMGVYYYPLSTSGDNYSWDYGLMDLARNGCGDIAVSATGEWSEQALAAVKHWDMEFIQAYNILNSAPNDYEVNETAITDWILSTKANWDGKSWNGESLGNTITGWLIADEVECGSGLTEPQKTWLRAFCDLHATLDPNRATIVNHCYPYDWYDLHEDEASATTGPILMINSQMIDYRVTEANSLDFDSFTAVTHPVKLSGWITTCASVNYWTVRFGPPCTQAMFTLLGDRSNYMDVYEQIQTAYLHGARGDRVYTYNNYSNGYSLVDANGNDYNGRMSGFGDAARDIRANQGCPGVTFVQKLDDGNTAPIVDYQKFSPNDITLVATPTAGSAAIDKVVFGKSINGGADWTTSEDSSSPYEATFSLDARLRTILRAQAVDVNSNKSVYAAVMIDVNNATVTPIDANDPYPDPCKSSLVFEAEDCNLSGQAGINGNCVDIAPTQSGSGIGTIIFPNSIPDGSYFLKCTWSVTSWGHWEGAVKIHTLGSGTILEHGALSRGDTGYEDFHGFYTRDGNGVYISGAPYNGEWSGIDYLAGPNGMEFDDIGYTMPTYITVNDIDAYEFAVSFYEPSTGSYDRFRIDQFELVPLVVPDNQPVYTQARHCSLSGYANDGKAASGAITIAADTNDGGQTIYTAGAGTMAFPVPIPDGDYILKIHYRVGSWSHWLGYFRISCLGSGTVKENGVVFQNAWHEFRPNYSGDSPYYTDELAGPNVADGNTMTESGWEIIDTAATWLTVSDVNENEFAVSIWDVSTATYDRFEVKYLELTPATVTAQ